LVEEVDSEAPPLTMLLGSLLSRIPVENKKRRLVTQHCIRGCGGGVTCIAPYSVASSFKFILKLRKS
jgi:hypothetical protein